MSATRGSCPFCGSDRIIPGAEMPDWVSSLAARDAVVRVSGGSGARAESPLDADVCGQCGHVQLFATRPEALWRAYERARRQP